MCTTKLISYCPRFKMLWTGKPSSVAMTNICFGVRQACQQVEQALPTFGKTDATLGGGGLQTRWLPTSSLQCEYSQNGKVCTLRSNAHWTPTVCEKNIHWTPAPWPLLCKELFMKSLILDSKQHNAFYILWLFPFTDAEREAKRCLHLAPVHEASYLNSSLHTYHYPTLLPWQSQ